jgi:hypothetical protein
VCNAFVPWGDPIAEDYVLERLLAQGNRPRLAVVEVGPDTIDQCNIGFGLHCHRQIVWSDTPTYFVDICRSGELRKLVATRLVPLYAHRRELLHQAGLVVAEYLAPPSPPSGPPDLGLSDGRPASWDSLLQLSLPPLGPDKVQRWQQDSRDQRKRFRAYRPGGTTTAAMERLLQRCREYGIEVVLVESPVTTYFRANYTPEVDAAYRAYLGPLARQFGCRFIDYREAVPDEAFGDLVHLNAAGGRYFTCRLTRDVLSPWLSERRAADGRP